jgi:cytochrome c5
LHIARTFLTVAFLLVAGISVCVAETTVKTTRVSLPVPSSLHDLGTVHEGGFLEQIITFENGSTSTVTLLSATPTCGCTVATAPRQEVAPGGTGQVILRTDMVGKRGKEQKDIIIVYSFAFTAVRNVAAHSTRNLQDHLFAGTCKSCHADAGVGKTGEPLFRAVCAQCHGDNAQGLSGPGFTTYEFAQRFREDWVRETIAHGRGAYMPGFAASRSGPLNTEQIESLVDYLREKVEAWRE